MITLSTGEIGSLDKYDENPFEIKTNQDICWYKFDHVIAWFSENILINPLDFIENTSVIIPKTILANLRRDCYKVLEHCVMPDGTYNIDEEYCKQIFPSLHIPFSGGSAYDKYFIEEIRDAKNDIDRLLLTSNEPDVAFIFHIGY